METLTAIASRRSICKFKPDPVSRDLLNKILEAATLAPSGKNKQPWRFYAVDETKRAEMIQKMQQEMDKTEEAGIGTGSAKYTIKVMAQAPVTIFIFNPTGAHPMSERDSYGYFSDVVDIQSIGAAIQNMLLAAVELGLGSLWICDVFFGYDELCDWLGAEGQMIAAVSLGYPDQSPEARPRDAVDDVTVYVE